MQILILVFLFIFWLLLGSFSSVVIDRLKHGKSGIVAGRSECPNCKHLLGSLDLIPLFSWLSLGGKCRYCKAPISAIYPALELTMWALFTLWYYYFVDMSGPLLGSVNEIFKLIFIVGVVFVTVVFTFYDIRFTEIPDEILIPAIFLILILLGVHTWHPLAIFSHFQSFDGINMTKNVFIDAILGAVMIYTFFYLQILIPGVSYALGQKKYKLALEVAAGYITFFWWMLTFLFTWRHEEETETKEEDMIPTWIGGWDLRIALFMGLILGFKLSLIALFSAYLIGSIIGIIVLVKDRQRGRMIPFGPFLWAGLLIALFWSTPILNGFSQLILHRF